MYRATDTRLGRDVALKVLPEAVAGSPELRETIRARGARGGLAVAPRHPRHPRLRDRGRPGLRRDGAARGADTPRPACHGAARSPPRHRVRAAARPGPRRRARQGRRAPRREAGQRVRDPRGAREGARLRPGAPGLEPPHLERRGQRLAHPRPRHRARHGARHGRLHVARAGEGPGGRRALRHLLFWRRALRDADREAGVPGRDGGGDDDRDPARRPTRARERPRGDPARPRAHRGPLPGEGPLPPLPYRPRPGLRARDGVGGLEPERRRGGCRRRRGASLAAAGLGCFRSRGPRRRGAGGPAAGAPWAGRPGWGCRARQRRPAHQPARARALAPALPGREDPGLRSRRHPFRRGRRLHPARGRGQRDQPHARFAGRRHPPGLLARRQPHRFSLRARGRGPVRHGLDRRVRQAAVGLRLQPELVAGRAGDRRLHGELGRGREPLREG